MDLMKPELRKDAAAPVTPPSIAYTQLTGFPAQAQVKILQSWVLKQLLSVQFKVYPGCTRCALGP